MKIWQCPDCGARMGASWFTRHKCGQPLKNPKRKPCEYCRREMSHGNPPLIRSEGIDIYIVRNRLCALTDDKKMADEREINYCPMCGRKLTKR